MKRDKIDVCYESLHIISVQCLQVDDIIPIMSPAVYCFSDLLGGTTF